MLVLKLIACAIVAVVLGILWYGPFFGKPWRREMGVSDEEVARERKNPAMQKKMMQSALIAAIGAFITAFVLSRAILVGGMTEGLMPIPAAFHFAFWNWLGFAVPVLLGAVLWEQKTWKWWLITIGYYLVSWSLMGLILVLWV
jgi:hypothetical protein